jgi:hypothetical protein
MLFGEADLENDALGDSSPGCSYVSAARDADDDRRNPPVSLRAPVPSPALLLLSGVADEPLRETREPFRLWLRETLPESMRISEPANIEESVLRAARSSFASEPPPYSSDRHSGVRLSAPHSIEDALLRAVDEPVAEEPLRERIFPNA